MSSEVRTTSATGGQKGVKDERFDLIPIGALTQLARHYGVGARKYDDNQWRKGYEFSKSYAAAQRHMTAWWGGEDIDEETGSSHLAAAAWHMFALMTFQEDFPEYDDRFRVGNPNPEEIIGLPRLIGKVLVDPYPLVWCVNNEGEATREYQITVNNWATVLPTPDWDEEFPPPLKINRDAFDDALFNLDPNDNFGIR